MILAWLLLVTVLVVFIQTWIYKKWGISNMHYERYFSAPAVFEGEQIFMFEKIANAKFLPVPWVRIESRVSSHLQFQKQANLFIINEQFHRSLFSLMSYRQITRKHVVTCLKRGYYDLSTVTMTTGDPFGVDERHRIIEGPTQLIVYPRLVSIHDIPLPAHSWHGYMLVRRWIVEDPFFMTGIRDYRHGDRMNTINWNATARAGSLQVNKKGFTAYQHLMIYLNFDQSDDPRLPIKDEMVLEKGISYAATIAQHAIGQGIQTGFGSNSYLVDQIYETIKAPVRIEPQNRKPHLIYLFEALSKLQMDRSMPFDLYLAQEENKHLQNTEVLLITAFMNEKIKQQVKLLEQQGNMVGVLWLEPEKEKTKEDLAQRQNELSSSTHAVKEVSSHDRVVAHS